MSPGESEGALLRISEDAERRALRPLADYLEGAALEQWEDIASAWVAATGREPQGVVATAAAAGSSGPQGPSTYRVSRRLGRGSQGTVYLAEDARLGRQVALKILEGRRAISEQALARFRREARLASKIEHPGICAVYDTGMKDGAPFIAMRYVEGATLADLLERWRSSSELRMSPSGTAELLERAAGAAHVAHEAGIIHRDLKPANLMVTPEGDPVITDFGLAREQDAELSRSSLQGVSPGTLAYMSPEQLRGEALDRRSDVWSLGVVLYECLTLRRPFDAETPERLYRQILDEEPAGLRRLNPTIPRDLARVTAAALEKDRDARYASAKDLAEDLRRVRQHQPILAHRPGPALKLVRWAQRNPVIACSVAGSFLSLAAGLLLVLHLGNRATRDAVAAAAATREVSAALDRETAARLGFEEMSDVSWVEDLQRREEGLWPCRSWMVPAMDRWCLDARQAVDRVELHRQARDALRERAAPYGEEDRAADTVQRRQRHPEWFAAYDRQKEEHRQLLVRLESSRNPRARSRIEERADDLEATLDELESRPEFTGRFTWTLASPEDRWRHDVLTGLVEALVALDDLVPRVEARREIADGMKRRTLVDESSAWERCGADIRSSVRYGHLELAPQEGLVPLGRDADSGLWEFWHVDSGPRPRWEGAALAGRALIGESSSIVLVLVPGGTFRMGAVPPAPDRPLGSPNVDPEAVFFVGPVHEVTLAPFFIGKHEMTQGQWMRATGSNPSHVSPRQPGITLRHPVEQVSWEDGREVLRRWGLSLPTEAQWEYACRAGTSTVFSGGDTAEAAQRFANVADETLAELTSHPILFEAGYRDGWELHAPVGTFPPNGFGLFEMHGNVQEWCRDGYEEQSYESLQAREGDGFRHLLDPLLRVIRGGGYRALLVSARSAFRYNGRPGTRDIGLGLRASMAIRSPSP